MELVVESCSESGALHRVDPSAQTGWDALLRGHPQHHFFASAAWARVLNGSYGFKPTYFAAIEGATLRALVPLMEVASPLTGRRGVSLPFTDECRPLGFERASFAPVFRELIAWGQTCGWKYLELRGGKDLLPDAPAWLTFYTHELGLAAGEAQLFAGLESSVRRALRKAERLGLTVEISHSLDAVRHFYRLHCQTRKKHGLPPQPFSFFEQIHHHVLAREAGMVVLVSLDRRPIAANVYFHLGGRAIYKYGASDETRQDLRGSNLVMWEAIKWYARHGFESLDFGRTSLGQAGLRRFKLGWGAQERSIEYVRFDLRQQRCVTGHDAAFGWQNRVFQKLPTPWLRWVGALLYRHVA